MCFMGPRSYRQPAENERQTDKTGPEHDRRQTQYNFPASSVQCVLEPMICPSLGGQNLLRLSLDVVEIDMETRFIFPWWSGLRILTFSCENPMSRSTVFESLYP